jgi:hypothetical protein
MVRRFQQIARSLTRQVQARIGWLLHLIAGPGVMSAPGPITLTSKVDMKTNTTSHPGLVLGAIFLSLFGATWLLGWAWQYPDPSMTLAAAIVLCSLGIVGWAIHTFRRRLAAYRGAADPAQKKRIRTALILINVVQWSSIGLLILGLNLAGHIEWIMPAVIFVVGVHFLPMAKVFRYRGYYLTAAALVIVAVADCAFGQSGQRIALSLLATGAILWSTAIMLLTEE